MLQKTPANRPSIEELLRDKNVAMYLTQPEKVTPCAQPPRSLLTRAVLLLPCVVRVCGWVGVRGSMSSTMHDAFIAYCFVDQVQPPPQQQCRLGLPVQDGLLQQAG